MVGRRVIPQMNTPPHRVVSSCSFVVGIRPLGDLRVPA